MPTYLTPGVYVEEVPSANKPIEGVGTSIAAFVGLAPGGPVNTPMRISNWTQFAKIFGDPANPDNGPFMEGAYLAHSVYGFFQNGGSLCWIVRVGRRRRRPAPPAPRCRRPATRTVEAFRAVALDGRRRRRQASRSTEEPEATPATDGGDATLQARRHGGRRDARSTTGLTLKKGRSNIATKVNAASKLIKLEETGASLPEAPRSGDRHATSCPRRRPRRRGRRRRTSRATSPSARAWAASPRSTRSRWSCMPGPDDARRQTATTPSCATSRAR